MSQLAIHAKSAVIENVRRDMADFGIGQIELGERVTVKMDTDQFNFKEDESVWKQKRGKVPNICEVYFDDVWCCDAYETDTHEQLRLKYLKGFLKGYEIGKIRLNRFLALIEDEKEKIADEQRKVEEKKAIENLPSSTPEEKAAKDIIKDLVTDEKEKK